jgi:hypothetical protein
MKSVTVESESMKRILVAFLFVVLLIPFQPGHATDLTLPKDTASQVYFSPDGGCIQAEALINLLDRKGIISKQELFEEMKRVKATLPRSERVGKG